MKKNPQHPPCDERTNPLRDPETDFVWSCWCAAWYHFWLLRLFERDHTPVTACSTFKALWHKVYDLWITFGAVNWPRRENVTLRNISRSRKLLKDKKKNNSKTLTDLTTVSLMFWFFFFPWELFFKAKKDNLWSEVQPMWSLFPQATLIKQHH